MQKAPVVQAFLERLHERLAATERAAAMAREEVASDETRSEGKYDTRATEASYLARGQAARVVALKQLIGWFETLEIHDFTDVQAGALVCIEADQREWVFLAPQGGEAIEVDATKVNLVSPGSPLGASMVTLEQGDAFEVDTPRGRVDYEVVQVL